MIIVEQIHMMVPSSKDFPHSHIFGLTSTLFYINCIRIFLPLLEEKVKGMSRNAVLLEVTLCIDSIFKLNIKLSFCCI